MTKYILFAPELSRYGKKICDGDLLYLGQFLSNNGNKVKLCDHNLSLERNLSNDIYGLQPEILIVNLAKNDILKGTFLTDLLHQIGDIRTRYRIKYVVAIGSISTALSEKLFDLSPTIDHIISERFVYSRLRNHVEPEVQLIQCYYKDFYNITSDYLASSDLHLDTYDIVSLCSSRGCENNCSFCSYNLHTIGWKERDVSCLVSDMKLLNERYNITRFSLFDNNFGSNVSKNEKRSFKLSREIQRLSFIPELSINIGLEGLSNIVLENFKKASVKGILVGLESLESSTAKYLYQKEIDIEKSIKLIEYAENLGVIPIVSYILGEFKLQVHHVNFQRRLHMVSGS